MHMEDGRVVSNFILQSIQNKDITIYGDGSQTRSFQYVDDLVEGLIGLMNSGLSILKKKHFKQILDVTLPVNVGNPDEHTIKEFATIIKDLTNSQSKVVNLPPTEDDPQRRRPDISRAKKEFDWEPRMGLTEGKNSTGFIHDSSSLQRTTRSRAIRFPTLILETG